MKNNKILFLLIILATILNNCTKPIELKFDNSSFCISDKNGGIIRLIIIQKIDSSEKIVCETMISKSLNSKGSNTICLFKNNKGYDQYKQCKLERGFYYKVTARNIGHSDTLIFRMK